MPLYEYRCDTCKSTFEVRQKFSDQPLTIHQGCGGTVQRLLSAPGLQFKGSGWYITDYARSGKSETGGEKSPAKTDSGKTESSGGSSESKPAAPVSSTTKSE
jgi:putative FmdB family regulatory protein